MQKRYFPFWKYWTGQYFPGNTTLVFPGQPWVHDLNRNWLHQGAYHNLVKELQFDEEKFQQYLRLTRKSKIPSNCSGNTCPWCHILDSPSVFFTNLPYEFIHGVIQFAVSIYLYAAAGQIVQWHSVCGLNRAATFGVGQQYYIFLVILRYFFGCFPKWMNFKVSTICSHA